MSFILEFDIPTGVTTESAVFFVVTLNSSEGVQLFRGTYCFCLRERSVSQARNKLKQEASCLYL
jgi:hypothetical protein